MKNLSVTVKIWKIKIGRKSLRLRTMKKFRLFLFFLSADERRTRRGKENGDRKLGGGGIRGGCAKSDPRSRLGISSPDPDGGRRGTGDGLAESVLRSRFGISSSSPLNVKVNHVIEGTNTVYESLPVLVGYYKGKCKNHMGL